MPWVTPPPASRCRRSARPTSRPVARHAVPADRVPGGGVPADRRADRHGHAGRPAARGDGRRPARPADGPDPGRGREHLPHRRPARPLQPPRIAGHGAGHHLAVLPAGRGRLGRARHGRPVGRGHPQGHRRRDRRPAPGPRPGRPWSASTTSRSARPATATAAPASRSRCAARTSSKPPTSARSRPGTALLLATGARPALIQLRPWYAGPTRARIAAAIRHAEDAMRDAARQAAHAAGRPAMRRGQSGAGCRG